MDHAKHPTLDELKKENDELTRQLLQSERVRSLGSLSGGFANHFNNLLSVILGYTSHVLNNEDLTHPAREALQRVAEAAERGRHMTDELLSFLGSETEAETICAVHETLSSVLSLLQSQMHSSVRVTAALDAACDKVLAPPSSIHQIVFNLLTNALDALAGSGSLTVRTTNVDIETDGAARQYLKIEVDEFMQAEASAAAAADRAQPPADQKPLDRAGLKLSSAYGMVGKLEGTLVVSSRQDATTRVEVLLPTASAGAEEPRGKPVKDRKAAWTIWVVDDDATFREMCKVVLDSEQGQVTEELAGGKEFMKKWERSQRKPELILIDFSMPDYNGLELCEWLTKHGSTAPVILVSGLSLNQPDIRKAMNMKKTYFLQKPFTNRELSSVISMAMGESLVAAK